MNDERINNTADAGTKAETIIAPFTPDEESPYIFVSYAHADRERVFPIITRLYEQGWRVWYDEGIPIGKESDYLDSLAKHISECGIVVAFVSRFSVTRQFVTEKELEYACGDADRRIIFCYLDKDAELPRSIKLLTAKKDKYPRTDEAGLEAVLAGIEGLTKTAPRKAVGYEVRTTGTAALDAAGEGDEYDFEKCEGGVRLTKYKGSEENVEIPEVYKGQPVVELYGTFDHNKTIKTVRVPATVRSIGRRIFDYCKSLTDVYIPASVREISESAFGLYDKTPCEVHCAEGTAAHSFAEKKSYLTVIIDNSLNVSKTIQSSASEKYAFCSYDEAKKGEAERITAKLAESGCNIISSGSMTDIEKLNCLHGTECFIAFVSNSYVNGNDLLYLRTAKNMGKSYIIYNLDGSALPADMDISMNAEQQLRYDSGTEEDRLTKLRNFLSDNGCVKTSADIPDYEYTTDTDGNIILTRYTGSDTEVVVPGSHAGHKVVELSGTFYMNTNLTAVTIPDSVTSIGDFAFLECENLTTLTIPDSVTSIGYSAFDKCQSLTSVNIPGSVTSIDDQAFFECKSLTSVNIPDSVTSIGRRVFLYCESLTTLTIPDSVTSIGDYAFLRCSSLTVYCPEGSVAWKYCEENNIPHKPLEQFTEIPAETPAPSQKPLSPAKRRSRAPLFILLALLAAAVIAAGVQLSGLFDILGWLGSLFA